MSEHSKQVESRDGSASGALDAGGAARREEAWTLDGVLGDVDTHAINDALKAEMNAQTADAERQGTREMALTVVISAAGLAAVILARPLFAARGNEWAANVIIVTIVGVGVFWAGVTGVFLRSLRKTCVPPSQRTIDRAKRALVAINGPDAEDSWWVPMVRSGAKVPAARGSQTEHRTAVSRPLLGRAIRAVDNSVLLSSLVVVIVASVISSWLRGLGASSRYLHLGVVTAVMVLRGVVIRFLAKRRSAAALLAPTGEDLDQLGPACYRGGCAARKGAARAFATAVMDPAAMTGGTLNAQAVRALTACLRSPCPAVAGAALDVIGARQIVSCLHRVAEIAEGRDTGVDRHVEMKARQVAVGLAQGFRESLLGSVLVRPAAALDDSSLLRPVPPGAGRAQDLVSPVEPPRDHGDGKPMVR